MSQLPLKKRLSLNTKINSCDVVPYLENLPDAYNKVVSTITIFNRVRHWNTENKEYLRAIKKLVANQKLDYLYAAHKKIFYRGLVQKTFLDQIYNLAPENKTLWLASENETEFEDIVLEENIYSVYHSYKDKLITIIEEPSYSYEELLVEYPNAL